MAGNRPLSPVVEEFEFEDPLMAQSFHQLTMEALGMPTDTEFQIALLRLHEHEAARTRLHPCNHLMDDDSLDSFKTYSEDVATGIFGHLNLHLLQEERDMVKDLVPTCTNYILDRLVSETRDEVCKRTFQEVECLILETIDSHVNGRAQAAGSRAETQYARLYSTVSETRRLLLKFREVTDWCLDKYSRNNTENLAKIAEQVNLWVRAVDNNKWNGKMEACARGTVLIGGMQQENDRFQNLAEDAKTWMKILRVMEDDVVPKAESRAMSVQNELVDRVARICNRI